MASNVLPLFWHLASSSRDTRIAAGADLVAAAEAFQAAHKPSANGVNKASNGDEDDDDEDDEDDDEDDDEEDDDDDDDDDGDMDVDGEGKAGANAEARALDIALARDNAPDVVYCVKRLVRGLASSRDSSRLGFAVALTELLARTPSVTAAEVLSLLERASPWSNGKGAEERDAMFARLFGVVAIADSGALFSPSATKADFGAVVDSLLALGNAKAWLAEAAGWALLRTVRGLLASKVAWRADVLGTLINKVYAEDKSWTPEKVALTVVLQSSPNAGEHDWKSLTAPTFRTAPLLSQPNLVALGRVLKEGGDSTGAAGAYTPKLHYVWDVILDAYFNRAKGEPAPPAPFADVFRVVVDEALFANTSSAERKYWGFQVFTRALPLLPADEVPLLFTPNFMRCWMNNLGSADRHLHRAALAAARAVQEHVRAHPAAGFPLLAQLVGRHGRPDFDRVTRTRTVETITASLTPDGVGRYVEYLEGVLLGRDDAGGSEGAASTEERRAWALDQMAALCRNGAVPKADGWVTRVLDDLLVTGFFLVRKADKKSKIAALRAVPKPPLTEATESTARARFFSALVDVTAAAAAPKSADKDAVSADEDAGADKWLSHALDMVRELEANPHTEVATDADDEIKNVRKRALSTLSALRGKSEAEATTRGIRLLVSFLLLQTYDDAEDALDMLDEVVGAAQALYPDKKAKRKSQGGDDDAPPPIDALLDVLIALLDKGSADLRTLANLVFGMLAPAMTASSIEHLVAQLEQSGAAEESGEAEEEDEEDDEDDDDDDDDEEDDEDEDEDEDEEEGSDSSDSDSDSDSSDANATVDPEFRRRVAEALKVSGALDEGEGGDGSDADSDSDESVWDDDQMMKVDEQLAAVFKQHAGNKAKKSLKHAAIESVHFKNRVLDFIDAFLRRPGPLALELVMPLLRVVRGGGELGNKAAGIVRTRLGKGVGSHTFSSAGEDASIDSARAAAILAEVHALARRAPSAEYSALCSAASLFAARFAPEAALATYAATLDDFIRRKHSGVQPSFIAEYVRRYPVRAWALADALASAGDVSSSADTGGTANAYRLVTAYTLLGQLLAHAPALVRAGDLSRSDAEAVLAQTMKGVYDTLERAAAAGADAPEAGFKADRLKALGKFALSVARTARTLATDAGADAAAAAASAAEVCDAPRLAVVTAAVKDGRTRDMKGVHALLAQLAAVLAAKPQKSQAKGAKDGKGKGKGKESAGVDAPKKKDGKKEGKSKAKTSGAGEAPAPTSKKRKAPPSDKPKAAKKTKA